MADKAKGRLRPAVWRACARLLGPRAVLLWLLPVVLLATFALFRAGLLIASRGDVASVAAGNVLRSFLVGLRYDAVAVGWMMVPLVVVLTLAPNVAFSRRWFRWMVTAYAAGIVALVILVEIVGAHFFRQFGTRLNWIALDYWGHFSEVGEYIRHEYALWVPLACTAAAFVAAWLLFGRLLRRGGPPAGPIWPRPVAAAALLGLCVLAARGSVDHHRLRFGPAYFSSNDVVSQLTLNNFFTFGEACKCFLDERRRLTDEHRLPPLATAWKVASEMLYQRQDEPLGVPGNPLWRRTTTDRPRRDYNVVVVIMEGMSGEPVGALGSSPTHTPNLDRLCQEGLFLPRLYGVGNRTCRGLVGIFCGHPDLDGKSLMKRSRALGNFLTLPGILKQRGYRTLFLFGGNPDFDNMKGFFGAGGVDRFIDRDQMAKDLPRNIWGVHDEGIFRTADEVFRSLGDQKFFAIVKTVSNHEPFDVPAGRTDLLPPTSGSNIQLNAYRYADWALGDFFRRASRSPYFRRTIFVLVADQERTVDRREMIDVRGNRLPCLIYGPGIVPPRRITTTASQTDISPTILSLLGGSYEHCFLGRDLLAADGESGFALLRRDDRLGFVWGQRALVLPPGRDPILYDVGVDALRTLPPGQVPDDEVSRARLQMLSYYLVARRLYLDNAYRQPKDRPLPIRPAPPEG